MQQTQQALNLKLPTLACIKAAAVMSHASQPAKRSRGNAVAYEAVTTADAVVAVQKQVLSDAGCLSSIFDTLGLRRWLLLAGTCKRWRGVYSKLCGDQKLTNTAHVFETVQLLRVGLSVAW